MRVHSERDVLKLRRRNNQNNNNKRDDLNISLSSNATFYENLADNLKWDIIFLINSGYEKSQIIKLYLYLKPNNVSEAIEYLTPIDGIYQHIFYPSKSNKNLCYICGQKNNLHLKKQKLINISSSFNSLSSLNINRNNDI